MIGSDALISILANLEDKEKTVNINHDKKKHARSKVLVKYGYLNEINFT